jgi:hypothetical protein
MNERNCNPDQSQFLRVVRQRSFGRFRYCEPKTGHFSAVTGSTHDELQRGRRHLLKTPLPGQGMQALVEGRRLMVWGAVLVEPARALTATGFAPAERDLFRRLARALRLDPDVVTRLHRMNGAPNIPPSSI